MLSKVTFKILKVFSFGRAEKNLLQICIANISSSIPLLAPFIDVKF